MYVVIFEVWVKEAGKEEYLSIAAKLKEQLVKMLGFISIERFSSLVNEGKILSLYFWESEKDIQKWKNNIDHKSAQEKGRNELFKNYRIRISKVERDYTMEVVNLTYIAKTYFTVLRWIFSLKLEICRLMTLTLPPYLQPLEK